jgi:hypothetical protein
VQEAKAHNGLWSQLKKKKLYNSRSEMRTFWKNMGQDSTSLRLELLLQSMNCINLFDAIMSLPLRFGHFKFLGEHICQMKGT